MKNIKLVFVVMLMMFTAVADCFSEPAPGRSKPWQVSKEQGQVQLSLSDYKQLLSRIEDPRITPRPAPAGYAIGKADIDVLVDDDNESVGAGVKVKLGIRIFEDDWVKVEVLPLGTAVRSARVDGKEIDLIPTPSGLTWGVKKAGSYTMTLEYQVSGSKSSHGETIGLPVPVAAAMNLRAVFPGTEIDATVIPSSGTSFKSQGNQTILEASIPTTGALQLSWRRDGRDGARVSRATYKGVAKDNAIMWKATYQVNSQIAGETSIALLPVSAILEDVQVDGKASAISQESGQFTTVVRGKGRHEIKVAFQIPVDLKQAKPITRLPLLSVPISTVSIEFPGKKELVVHPASNIETVYKDNRTIAFLNVPMTSSVDLRWSEAVPDQLTSEVRTNATVYHTAFAEEGLLSCAATVIYEVSRGETSVLDFKIPADVQVNRVSSADISKVDWQVIRGDQDSQATLKVFLDRKLNAKATFLIEYDKPLGNDFSTVEVPLLEAKNVRRQRGMVALLSGKEMSLSPVVQDKLTSVGENQLPSFIHDSLSMTVAHTLKYAESDPVLKVKVSEPERKQGKYNAVVDTLVSLSDVTMKGEAAVEVSVKSGSLDEITFELPKGTTLLNLSGPSVRTHSVKVEENRQEVRVEFTQGMDGHFRIDLAYEFIMSDGSSETPVPTVSVPGAEIEHGRIAIETLSALEVLPAVTEQLSTVDIGELPQQLVLKTTNPIQLAFKYVKNDPPYKLSLKITRHSEIEVQAASIDSAHYYSLFTEDGQVVTSADWFVRNSREQFLKLRLPEGSKVWSAFVDGKPEKPALAKEKDGSSRVLIKIRNSLSGFPVRVVYQTPVSEFSNVGIISGLLPSPDMVVTNTNWDVYLPDEYSYGEPDSNLKLVNVENYQVRNAREARSMVFKRSSSVGFANTALNIQIPLKGKRLSFQKLYANQSKDGAYFSVPYTTKAGSIVFHIVALFVGLFASWTLINGVKEQKHPILSPKQIGTLSVCVICIWALLRYAAVSYIPVVAGAGIIVVSALAAMLREKMESRNVT